MFFSDMRSVTLDVRSTTPIICDCFINCDFNSQFDNVLEGISNVVHARTIGDELYKGSIEGRLLDKESKEPILFSTVVIYVSDKMIGMTETDLDGNYKFNNLTPGTYDLEFSYIGYQAQRLVGVEIKLEESSNPCLRFYDEKNQDALIGVNVLIYKDNTYLTGTSSNNSGDVSLRNLENGHYRFQFRYLGYEPIDTVLQIDKLKVIKIPMHESSFALNEVVIVGRKVFLSTDINTCFPQEVEVLRELVNVSEEGLIDERIDDKNKINNLSRLQLFPNPCSDFIHLTVGEETASMIITSQEGKIMYKESNPQTGFYKFSVVDYPVGSYFISLNTKEGILTEKLIVVR